MHPIIKPMLRRSWRDRHTVRYGVTPSHSVLFGPLDGATETFLTLLDGTRGMPALREAAVRLGLDGDTAEQIADRLTAAGVLEDATADRQAAAQVTDGLRPDLASLSLLDPEPGGGLRRLLARRGARVQVRGAGRVGATLAATLARAGVGTVEVVDGGRVEPPDTAPGGVRPEQAGERRSEAARRVVRESVPWRRGPGPVRDRRRGGPQLVIYAPREGTSAYVLDPGLSEGAQRAGTAHLFAGVVEATGFYGPLVRPGVTGCAGCLLRARAQREPGWPLLVSQWRNGRLPGVPACDTALATAVAGLAAAEALRFLDGVAPPGPSVRTEVILPELSVRRHTIEPHADCSCGAARQAPVAEAVAGPGASG
ncbi:TOMM precursor leader peptide-binding protein [Streptomyces sp. 7-21]|uniref:TOMM precursor leader peptide-binding protein n=1 Tax=Streptomyces sp. 7-21 TaxID=2802283 RepID=UPI00191D48A6|nr:TOMM precursor leader peptide-binding protein [Streptomyces sp. 7-21]MBL1066328.1 TOMM precursor leader peptide-binding protein [Streptomyces sp. 7-21]